ncbi:hypothetical protein HQ563_16220 [bacterium]|nr:hypothetical protein [bacterium]
MDTPEIIIELSALLALMVILLIVLRVCRRERKRKAVSQEEAEPKFQRLASSSLDLPSQAVEEAQDQTSERCWPLQEKKEEFEGERQEPQREPLRVGQIDRLSIEQAELTREHVSSPAQEVEEEPKTCEVINDKEGPSHFAEGAIAIADDESSGESITVEPVPPETIFECVSAIPEETPKIARTTRIAPEKRGGRPRGREEEPKKHEFDEGTLWCPRPEIICWKRERQWMLGVEVPEELLEKAGLKVLQDGSPLAQDEFRESCWCLNCSGGDVVVRWKADGVPKEVKVALDEEKYLLFKLSGQSEDRGRRVKSPSSGSYLVIVPCNWERDEDSSGPPPAAPEPVSLPEYSAHFFYLEKLGDRRIGFNRLSGEPFRIKSTTSRFELVGARLPDASEHVGPLFGEGPPKIRSVGDRGWKGVGTIVVGQEGRGRKRWRTWFSLDTERIDQDLPPKVAARKGGWYFLRFYNTTGDLLESLDFRFVACLRDIRIHQPPPLPPEGGHKAVCIEFLHQPNCKVRLSKESLAKVINIEPESDRTVATIPPDPACDETSWLLVPDDGAQLKLSITVDRVWWAIGEEGHRPSQWRDRPLSLLPGVFDATSTKAIWLRLPRRRWVDKVSVGFEKSQARPYPVKLSENTVLIPLREFGDLEEARTGNRGPLVLWIHTGETTQDGVLWQLKLPCKFCGLQTSSEEDLFSHLWERHFDELFVRLTYEEMRARLPTLPRQIYKCGYCNVYVRSDEVASSLTSAICVHIQSACSSARRERKPVTLKFRIITDLDEIRENIIRDLPDIRRCRLCSELLENPTRALVTHHLLEKHKADFLGKGEV